jgi:glycosyltransferase involved in cell wall biosynthesis
MRNKMDLSPLVTVITPAFNVAKYVGEAIDSVLRQTATDFEYIVVDDGSTDNTADVARAHAGDDPRVRVITAEHRGLSATRNRGIKEARGRYIAFLDGDDRWHPRFIERQLALLESLPDDVGAVFCRSRMVLENGTPVGVQWQRAGRYDFDDILVNTNPPRNGSSLLIRKSCFDDVGGFDESQFPGEDLEMWLRITDASESPFMWGNRHFLVDLRLRPGSVTRDRSAMYEAVRELLEKHTPRLRHAPPGLAYVHVAVTALKYGDGGEDLAEELAAQARTAGVGRLMRSSMGWRLLLWSGLSRPGRATLRTAQHEAREAVKAASRRLRG